MNKIKVRRKPTLKEAMEKAGWTKAKLADRFEDIAHKTTVYRWLDDDYPQVPRNKYKVHLEHLFGTQIRWPEPTTTKWSAANKQTPQASLGGPPPTGLPTDIKDTIRAAQNPTSPASEILQKEEELKKWIEHRVILWKSLGKRVKKFEGETGLSIKAIGLKTGTYWGEDKPKIYILRERA